jgi:hypothetical protein
VGLTFSRVQFDKPKNEHIIHLDKWNYSDIGPNEFYGFESYNLEDKILGVAVYGLVSGNDA